MEEGVIEVVQGVSPSQDALLDGLPLHCSVHSVVAHILDDSEDRGDVVSHLLPFLHADVALALQHDLLAL